MMSGLILTNNSEKFLLHINRFLHTPEIILMSIQFICHGWKGRSRRVGNKAIRQSISGIS